MRTVLIVVLSTLFISSGDVKHPCEYQFIVEDNNVNVYDGNRCVGKIALDGSLKTLINKDNE